MKLQFSSGIVIYHQTLQGNEYLLLHYQSGHWDFAKGKMEQGETKEQAALRELAEETGITQATILPGFEESLEYFFKDKDRSLIHKTVYFFTGPTKTKEIKLSYEHIGYAWLPYEKAMQQLSFQNAKDVLYKAHAFCMALENA